MYAGGQSILVGTPSGVTLAPEDGAHQSVITPSIGIEQPGCVAWEPASGQDLEWTLLPLGQLGRPQSTSAYFRLSTRPIDQTLASIPSETDQRERRRKEVLAGGYLMREAPGTPMLTLVAMSAVLPEVLAAAHQLGEALSRRHPWCPIACLGVGDFGQVGDVAYLYRHFGIDTDTIIGAS
jgi:pyruvate dehydrogenase E1 component